MSKVLVTDTYLTNIANAIREKNGEITTYKPGDMAGAILNISSENESVLKSDVNFYDYDGTIVASYTKEEFLTLTDLPENPTHRGLISEGWNWDLNNAQTYVALYDKLNIGQMYITDDGTTRIYIELTEEYLSPYISVNTSYQNKIKIDWGDGNITQQTMTYYSSSINHQYASPGSYVITIYPNPDDNEVYLTGNDKGGSQILWANVADNSTGLNLNMPYRNAIKKIEIGEKFRLYNSYVFENLGGLEAITIPSYMSFDDISLNKCYSLKHITITPKSTYNKFSIDDCITLKSISFPQNTGSISNSAFMHTRLLHEVNGIMPNDISYLFNLAYGLHYYIVPETVTVVGTRSFYECYNLKYIDFTRLKNVPTKTGDSFYNTPSDMVILVPYTLFVEWKSATNWSNFTTQMVAKALGSDLGNTGDELPTIDSEGSAISWYDDMNCTNVVTTIDNVTKHYYCKNL